MLGIPIGTVRSRMHRARATLKRPAGGAARREKGDPVTDELELIRGFRAEDAVPDPDARANARAALVARTAGAATEPLSPTWWRSRRGPARAPGMLVAVTGVVVGVAIAIIAVTGLSRSGTAGPITSASARVSEQALVRQLAILRRAQTAADRTLPPALATRVHGSIVQGLSRLALRFDGTPIYVIVRSLSISLGSNPPAAVHDAGLARHVTVAQLELAAAPPSGPAVSLPVPLPGLFASLVSARQQTRNRPSSYRISPGPAILQPAAWTPESSPTASRAFVGRSRAPRAMARSRSDPRWSPTSLSPARCPARARSPRSSGTAQTGR